MKEIIIPSDISKATARYVPGIKTSVTQKTNFLFISGQVSINKDGNIVGKGEPEKQTITAFENIRKVLKKAGGDIENLVAITIYITDLENLKVISNVRNNYFEKSAVTSTLVEVKGLVNQELLVEISGLAVL